MNVHVKIIPHSKQRYDTVGDWFYDEKGDLQIRVSEMSDARYEQLVEIHERIEASLCDDAGVMQEDVDKFDMEFERLRHGNEEGEPGDSVLAPYHRQHRIATGIEMLLAVELGVDWQKYEEAINGLE